MCRVIAYGLISLATLTLVSGCSWRDVRDVAVNSAMPSGTAHVMRDVGRTADEIAAEESEERTEELSAEYEEFLRENSADSDDEDDEERSIIMVDPEESY